MVKKVKVIATDSSEVLFEVPIEEMEKAYEYASSMEKMGIDVSISAPTISETLSDTLGLGLEDKSLYEDSIQSEIEDHDGSCCVKKDT